MVAQNLARNFYAYISDNTTTYQVATTNENGATVNEATPAPVGSNPVFPRGWKMRRIYGKEEGGTRTAVPVLDPSNGLWTGSTTTFTKNSTSYTVEGKIGEKRTNKS